MDILVLLALEARLSQIVRTGGEPLIAQMKLAWWRDRLAETSDQWPTGEPLLEALRDWSAEASTLRALVDGWEGLLGETLSSTEIEEFARGRAVAWGTLANAGGVSPVEQIELAARQMATADLAVHLGDPRERQLALACLRTLGPDKPTLSRSLRPLAVLRSLAMRAATRGSQELLDGPAAMLVALRVGITGR